MAALFALAYEYRQVLALFLIPLIVVLPRVILGPGEEPDEDDRGATGW
jgi:hypothetical protein